MNNEKRAEFIEKVQKAADLWRMSRDNAALNVARKPNKENQEEFIRYDAKVQEAERLSNLFIELIWSYCGDNS